MSSWPSRQVTGCNPVKAGATPAEDLYSIVRTVAYGLSSNCEVVGEYASGQSGVIVNHTSKDFAGSSPCLTDHSTV